MRKNKALVMTLSMNLWKRLIGQSKLRITITIKVATCRVATLLKTTQCK